MQEKIMKLYKCESCEAHFFDKSICESHEHKCPWLESNRGCVTCKNRIRNMNLTNKCSKNLILEQDQTEFYNTINCEYWEVEK